MSELKKLINTRKYIRKLVTEKHDARHNFHALSPLEKSEILSALSEHKLKLNDLDTQIQNLLWSDGDESKFDSDLAICEEYAVKLRECNSLLHDAPQSRSNFSVDAARSLLKSPTAPLPKFRSAENEDLVKFFAEFEETISKHSYPDYDKLLLLKQQISGRALTLVNSLEASKQGYSHAKDLLMTALASPDIQIFNTIKQLSELKLSPGADPFEYVAKMRVLTENVNKLNIDINEVLRYFFWNGLSENFQCHLTQITNHTRPSLQEINDKFFEASERYIAAQKLSKAHRKSISGGDSYSPTSLAVNVEGDENSSNGYKACSLCFHYSNAEFSHPIFKCSRFPTADHKLIELRRLNACIKCADLGHTSESCKCRFNQRCRHCSGWHLNFLCSAFNNSNVKEAPDVEPKLPTTQGLKGKD